MSKLNEANEKIANGVVDGFKKIENGVVEGYKKIEGGVVDGYKKIEDKFVNTVLTHEGETAEDAKKRLAEEAAARKKAAKEAAEKRAAANPVNVSNIGKVSVDVSKNIGKH